jgi:hypothetical protein
MRFPFCVFHRVLLWFHAIVMMRFVFHTLCFLIPPPLHVPLFVLILPRLAVVALSDMVNIKLNLLFVFYDMCSMLASGIVACNARMLKALLSSAHMSRIQRLALSVTSDRYSQVVRPCMVLLDDVQWLANGSWSAMSCCSVHNSITGCIG